jgi:hypothetical protein
MAVKAQERENEGRSETRNAKDPLMKSTMKRGPAIALSVSVVALFGYLLVSERSAAFEARGLRESYNWDFSRSSALAHEYQEHRREKEEWPPPGKFSDHEMMRFVESRLEKGLRIDQYRPSTPGKILEVTLRDDGMILIRALDEK